MPVSAALRRLLRVRELEEEQQKLALESALADLHVLEHALTAARSRQRRGRERIAPATDPAERIAALVDADAGARHAATLRLRIAAAEREAALLRERYLSRRVERRQAETLIRETEAQDDARSARRAQQGHDDWFGGRLHRDQVRADDEVQPPRPEPEEL